jgi:hypothetical protein
MSTQTEAQTLIDDCIARESRLTEWEREFVSSIQSQIAEGKTLTRKQVARLAETWDRVTSEAGARR